MNHHIIRICFLAAVLSLAGSGRLQAQAVAKTPDPETARAEAYYNFAMGHLYAELAGAYGGRGGYLQKAIDHYRAALKLDERASFITGILAELYIQAGQWSSATSELETSVAKNPADLNSRRLLARLYTSRLREPGQPQINEDLLKKAVAQYEEIVARDSKDVEAWLWLGRLHRVAERSKDAEAAFQKALEADPDNEEALTSLAQVYADLGDSRKATDLLKRVAEKNPGLRSFTNLAAAYEQLQQYELAAKAYEQALSFQPNNLDLKRAMANSLAMADQTDRALSLYQELEKEDANDLQTLLRLSQLYQQKRQFAKAREYAERASALAPENVEILYNEVALLEREGRMGEAIARLEQILKNTERPRYGMGEMSNRVILLERLGSMYRAAEQYKRAEETFLNLAKLDPSARPRALAQLIDTYRVSKDYDKAERTATDAVKEFPNDRILKVVRATLLADLGKVDEAAAELRSLLAKNNDRETLMSLAQVYEKGKRFKEMAQALDEAEKLCASDAERESVWFLRGAMYERMKRYEAAEAEFRRVLKLNPENASALNYLGYMLADRNERLDEAYELIQKALEVEPENGAYLDSLGWVYYRQGKYEEAAESLRRSLEKTSRDPVIHDHLGDVYLKLNRLKEAILHWERALEEWKSNPPADRDPSSMAEVQKKIEGARIRMAKESKGGSGEAK